MKPRWMKRRVACPECGHILKENEGIKKKIIKDANGHPIDVRDVCFDCPICKSHWPAEDFWEEQYEKWDRTMKEEVEP